jgi:hypothetical protein
MRCLDTGTNLPLLKAVILEDEFVIYVGSCEHGNEPLGSMGGRWYFSTKLATVSLSRRPVLHGLSCLSVSG